MNSKKPEVKIMPDFTSTWEKCYVLTKPTLALKKSRLEELKTWSKPLVKKENDTYGHWHEWECKIKALENLIKKEEEKNESI